MVRLLLASLLSFSILAAAESAAAFARQIRDTGLDAGECYRVRDFSFTRDDVKIYLTEGYLIFGKPIDGKRVSAIFNAADEGGDAEVILLPPQRDERQSLAKYTGSPNLDEHFRQALFIFSGGAGKELLDSARQAGKRVDDRGLMMADKYSSIARNLSESFQLRIVEDLLNPSDEGLFFTAVAGTRLGNFDIVHDPRNREQIMVGQFSTRNNAPVYDIWSNFESRTSRRTPAPRRPQAFSTSDDRIEAVFDDSLHVSAVTRFKVTPTIAMRAFPLIISDRMQITSLEVEGRPAELFVRDSLRANAMRAAGSSVFLAVTPEPLQPGRSYEFQVKHDGDVVIKAGNGVYAIAARGTWYPFHASEFAQYDLTFRYPKRLTLVATGDIVDERTEGDVRVTHRKTSSPVRFVGFNLGDYERVIIDRGGYQVQVYGNRQVETALQRAAGAPMPPVASPARPPMRRGLDLSTLDAGPAVQLNPTGQLSAMASEVAGAVEFMSKQLGPPPLKVLAVTPLPGTFGQGFPGLVYLSTLSYMPAAQRVVVRDKLLQTFFSDLLAPHEVAHQWWGNLVITDAHQDSWLMEALASYSALMYLEKRKGAKALESVLDAYRTHLMAKRKDGETVESMGPITWGSRLETSDYADARTIVYEKGAWILHMLRLKMGDAAFQKLLAALCSRSQFQSTTTGSFQALAEEMTGNKGSLQTFFDTWVYGTGVPALKLSTTTKGKAPALKVTATLTQSGVDEDFTADVPVEIQFPGAPPVIKWIRSSSEPVTVTIPVKRMPSRIGIASGAILVSR